MIINGKDIKFKSTIGSHCDFMDYCAANPEVSMMRANVYKAVFMNAAFVNGHPDAEKITVEEIMNLPKQDYDRLMAAVAEAEKEGNRQTVETQDTGKKKGINK